MYMLLRWKTYTGARHRRNLEKEASQPRTKGILAPKGFVHSANAEDLERRALQLVRTFKTKRVNLGWSSADWLRGLLSREPMSGQTSPNLRVYTGPAFPCIPLQTHSALPISPHHPCPLIFSLRLTSSRKPSQAFTSYIFFSHLYIPDTQSAANNLALTFLHYP